MAVVAIALSGCGAANETSPGAVSGAASSVGKSLSGTLNGAGSTAQEAAMAAWKAGFQSANAKVTVNYDAVGSGSGVAQFLAGGVDFAGSDAYLADSQVRQAERQCASPIVEVPVYISPIALIYNLPGVSTLNLSQKTIAEIFSGAITSWSDPAIKADNPGAALPSTRITPVHRSDSSGTTANFTDYLGATAGEVWTAGSVETWPIKGGEGADGTSGVVQAVTSGNGAIGYADASQVGSLSIANIGVGKGFAKPSAQGAAAAVERSAQVDRRPSTDLAIDINRTLTGHVYPIVLVSYQVACAQYGNPTRAALAKAFLSYVVSGPGQRAAAKSAGSAPLPAALSSKAQAALASISSGS